MNLFILVFVFLDCYNMIFYVLKIQEVFFGGVLDINGRSSSTVRCSLVIFMSKRVKNFQTVLVG